MADFEKSDRGFKHYEPFITDYGHELRVYESSSAMRPCLWLAVGKSEKGVEDLDGIRHVHMTLEQAERLRDNLEAAIQNHYQTSEG